MSSSNGAAPLESTGDRGFIDRSPNKDRTQNRGDYPILGPSEWAEIKDRRFFEVKGLLIPKPRTSPLPEDVVSEETQARIEEALQRTRNHRLRQWARLMLWEDRIKELFGTGSEERQRTLVANLGEVPGWDQEPTTRVVEVSQTVHHPKRHSGSGRPLEAHEYSLMREVARVIVGGGGGEKAVDTILDKIYIRPGIKHWRDLERHIGIRGEQPWGEGRHVVKAQTIYWEALAEVVERYERHVLSDRAESKRYWQDDSWSSKSVFHAVNREAWRIAYKDLTPIRWGLGPENLRRARDESEQFPLRVVSYDEMLGSHSPGGGYGQPGGDVVDDDEDAERRAAREQAARDRKWEQDLKAEQDALIDRQVRAEEKLLDKGLLGYTVKSVKVLPRDEDAIAEERAHWQVFTGKKVTPSRHPTTFDPYLGSESLRLWDLERDRSQRVPYLRPGEWQVLALRYFVQYEYPVISDILGMTQGAVRTYRSRGLKKVYQNTPEKILKSTLGEEYVGP